MVESTWQEAIVKINVNNTKKQKQKSYSYTRSSQILKKEKASKEDGANDQKL